MKTLTRKSFLKILGTGASITALCALPTIAASAADNDLVELEPTSFISEMNAWYQANGIPFALDQIDCDQSQLKISDVEKLISDLQNIQITHHTEYSNNDITQLNSSFSSELSEQIITPREIMRINFSRTATDELTVWFQDGVIGTVCIEITITGIADDLRSTILEASGSACERSSVNLSSIDIAPVSVSKNSPSTVMFLIPLRAALTLNGLFLKLMSNFVHMHLNQSVAVFLIKGVFAW